MRLLLAGSDHVWSIERTYFKYLSELQPDIRLFPAQNYFYEWYNRSIVNKVLYRAGLSGIISRINQQLKQVILEFQPSVILVFKGMEIQPATLRWIREQGIFLANYNPDNPFIFSGAGSGNKNVTNSISLYDLHFTYNLEIKDRLEKEFKVTTALLPFGFDVSPALYETCRTQEEVNKVCFLGNPDEGRVTAIRALLEQGVSIDVYGHHWNKFIQHDNLTIFEAVYGDEFWKVLNRYRVQLNLMRVHNEQSHNMRTFEIPGIGAIQLAPDTPEHRLFFEPGREIFLFRDAKECFGQIEQLLGLSAASAMEIRLRARAKSLAAGYSYKDRAAAILDTIQGLQAARSQEKTFNAQI